MNPITRLLSSPRLSTFSSRVYGSVCQRLETIGWEGGDQANLVTRISNGVSRRIYLTFDDGPGPTTERVLTDLENAGAKATFFFSGSALTTYARPNELLCRITLGNHTVGLHGNDHLNAWKVNRTHVVADQEEGLSALGRFAPLEWARPPYGRLTPALYDWYRSKRLRVALWDVDPADYSAYASGRTSPDVIKFVLQAVRPGSIVLLHENSRVWGGDLSGLVTALIDQGWELAALPVINVEPGSPQQATGKTLTSAEMTR